MDLLLNDLSIHEQFHDFRQLQRAFGQLINMRSTAEKYDIEVKSSYYISRCKPMPDTGLSEAIDRIPDINLKRTVLSWLYKYGPFWEDKQEHYSNDWLECKDETIVTDSSVGEAAFRILHGGDCGLISIAPSNWTYSPIHVTFRTNEHENSELLSVKNWWIPHELENDLKKHDLITVHGMNWQSSVNPVSTPSFSSMNPLMHSLSYHFLNPHPQILKNS